jgi:hypothetical protein
MAAIFLIDASQPLHTPAGRVVGRMYYGNFLDSVLRQEEYSGFPNNGPEHTLFLKLSFADFRAFIALVRESFDASAAEAFYQSVAARMEQSPIRVIAS